MVFLIRRLQSSTVDDALLADAGSEELDQVDGTENTKRLVGEQLGRIWNELTTHKLKVQPDIAANLMAQTLISLHQINEGALWNSYILALSCDNW